MYTHVGEPTLELTRDVFLASMKRIGYKGPHGMLLSLFKKIDGNGNGVLGFAEMREWMTGRMRRQTEARIVHLLWGRTDGMTLDRMPWSSKLLKCELVAMLMRAELAPLDLVRAWDQSNDNSFSSREFLIMMKKIVFTTALSDDGTAAAKAAAKAQAAKQVQNAQTEGGYQWTLAKTAGLADETAKDLKSLDDIARDQAAVKLQAFARGRLARRKLMSREDADKLWYSTIKPVSAPPCFCRITRP